MLEAARNTLTTLLEKSDIIEAVQKSPEEILDAMEAWFLSFKQWEKGDDDFKAIWRDHRMFLRSIGAGDSVYGTLQAKAPSYDAWKAKGWESAAGTAVPVMEFSGIQYNTGKEGILQRVVPDNVTGTTASGQKKKYVAGLMDLSGTVLRNDKAISEQLHKRPSRDDWACFVPLSEQEDQELLMLMKDKLAELQVVLGKTDKNLNRVIAKYKAITSEVTRLKLAFETEMALDFVAIPSPDGTYSKFKYMVKSKVTYSMNNPDAALRGKDLHLNDELAKLLRNNVKRYKSVVGMAIKNEVRIAVRKHENPKWPLFARWDGDSGTDKGEWVVWAKDNAAATWAEQKKNRIANTLE